MVSRLALVSKRLTLLISEDFSLKRCSSFGPGEGIQRQNSVFRCLVGSLNVCLWGAATVSLSQGGAENRWGVN